MWMGSKHPLIIALRNRGIGYATDTAECDALAFEDDKAVCLIEKYLGREAKPEVCREHDGDWRCGAEVKCVECGCTDTDCRQCVAAQGHSCYWVGPGKCSRCFDENGQLKG